MRPKVQRRMESFWTGKTEESGEFRLGMLKGKEDWSDARNVRVLELFDCPAPVQRCGGSWLDVGVFFWHWVGLHDLAWG